MDFLAAAAAAAPEQPMPEGAVDAAVFLAARVAAEEKKRQFTMVDVLRSGAM